jgi:hypothetical protein
MKRFLVLLGICASCFLNASGQDVDSINSYLTVYQRVAFNTSDSTYHFTIFIEPNGKFYFRNGYSDSTLENDSSTMVRLKKREVTGQYRLKYHFQTDIDTINCILPIEGFEDTDSKTIQISDKLKASYVLKQLGEYTNIQENEIRLLYPCEELNQTTHYRLVKINLFNESAEINIITGGSTDYKGVQTSQNRTSLLKKGDIKMLKKQLDKLKGTQSLECRQPGNPWVMELYNDSIYKSFTISNHCLQGRKEIRPIGRICYSLLSICKNYFNIDCSVD